MGFPASVWLAAFVPAAWLLTNHYLPWLAAWQDGASAALLCAALLTARRTGPVAWPWITAAALAVASVAAQAAGGRILYAGDAFVAAFYVLLFLVALALGAALGAAAPADPPASAIGTAAAPAPCRFPEAWATGIVAAAILSTAVALVQWTGVWGHALLTVDMPPGGRPFANVAQPNHFCTIAFLGLCALALLHERGRIGRAALVAAGAFLAWGMAMSGSRTGWLQVALLVVAAAWFGRRMPLRTGLRTALVLAAQYVAAVLLWPHASGLLDLGPAREFAEQMQPGTRWAHWTMMLDAIGRQPWTGYGWQQVGLAQQAVALDHPPVGEHIEHSHNLVLDLLVWAGVPVGGAILLAIGLAVAGAWRRAVAPEAAWLLVAAGGFGVHALLEYPHEYAYFLIPVGLALGAAHALEPQTRGWRWPRPMLPVAGGVLSLALGVIAYDYLRAEASHRLLRFESARIGVDRIVSTAPDLIVLDQLQAFLEFARTEARPGMTAAELQRMRAVAERSGSPPVMLRYALAAGLNGQPAVAERTAGRLCRIHPAVRCDEGREAWAALQKRYPQLSGIAWPAAAAPNGNARQQR